MKCRYLVLFISFLLICFCSCKKNNTAPQNTATAILGKWYVTSHTSTTYSEGKLLDTATRTSFTTNDYIQYFSDGSGILSSEATPSPSYTQFKYTINGQTLVQSDTGGGEMINETIKTLTVSSMAIHFTITYVDIGTGDIDIETDDYSFKR